MTLPIFLGEGAFNIFGTTEGTFDRLHVVPFSHPPVVNTGLVNEARNPHSAFCRAALRWLLDGAAFWLLDGDGETPTAVTETTKVTRADFDAVAAWLTDHGEAGTAGEQLGRLRAAGLDSGEKVTPEKVSRRAKKLGWKAAGKRTNRGVVLNPP